MAKALEDPGLETAASSLADVAYREVRRRIILCDIEPGSWVTEGRLAVELGVGKTPTREALGRLATEGFVRATHRRGYEVTPITIAGVLEIFDAFDVIGPQVAALVVERAGSFDRAALPARAQKWLPGVPGAGQITEGELSHFVRLTGNPTIIEMSSGVVGHMERIFNFVLLHGGMTDRPFQLAIDAALTTITGENAEEARTAFRHLNEVGRSSVTACLQSAPSLMTASVALITPQA